MTFTWRELDREHDLPGVLLLARRCLEADGGLPLVADEPYVRRRYAVSGVRGVAVVGADSALIAASATRTQDLDGSPTSVITGMVDPDFRGIGLGTQLLDRALLDAEHPVMVEVDALTPTSQALIESRGLRRVWAEDVMRFSPSTDTIPDVRLPAGLVVREWTADSVGQFHRAYEASFRDRPGFPGWSVDEWVRWTTDEDFLPGCSLLVVDGARELGFITCAAGWIVQVGVRPEERGRGLGAALVAESLRRLRDTGAMDVLLDVNVDNPARELYRRLGFTTIGRRARFTAAEPARDLRF